MNDFASAPQLARHGVVALIFGLTAISAGRSWVATGCIFVGTLVVLAVLQWAIDRAME